MIFEEKNMIHYRKEGDQMSSTIMIMEDDENINNLLKMHLVKEGYQVIQAFDGKQAMDLYNENIDLAILDVMVPVHNGFEVLNLIRSKSEIPIIFLTAKDEDADKVLALGLGADDYVTKPFSVIEVISRVKAHLRRYLKYSGKQGSISDNVILNGKIKLEKSTMRVFNDEKEISLSSKEYKILLFFMENLGHVFTKRQLYENVWEDEYYGDDNTIMVHISRLREKLENDSREPEMIKTVKGLGYRMEKI